MISTINDKSKGAASSLSAETYNLEIIKKNIENEKGNLTRFLVMGKIFLNQRTVIRNILHLSYLSLKVNQLPYINPWVVLQLMELI